MPSVEKPACRKRLRQKQRQTVSVESVTPTCADFQRAEQHERHHQRDDGRDAEPSLPLAGVDGRGGGDGTEQRVGTGEAPEQRGRRALEQRRER